MTTHQGFVPMFTRFLGLGSLLAAVAVLLAGCSGNQTAAVTGMVRVDGEPLEKGSISFVPVDGKGVTAGGEILDGKYTVAKVSPGTMTVQIRYPKVAGTKKLDDTPESPTRDVFREALPAKFNDRTELRLEVQAGNNEKDWDLSPN
jgi:hypothetical protein